MGLLHCKGIRPLPLDEWFLADMEERETIYFKGHSLFTSDSGVDLRDISEQAAQEQRPFVKTEGMCYVSCMQQASPDWASSRRKGKFARRRKIFKEPQQSRGPCRGKAASWHTGHSKCGEGCRGCS